MFKIHETDFKYPLLAHRNLDQEVYARAVEKPSSWVVATNLIATLKPGADRQSFMAAFEKAAQPGAYEIIALPLPNTYLIVTRSAHETDNNLLRKLPGLRERLEGFASLEEDVIYFIQQTPETKEPDDAHLVFQEDLLRIKAREAWSLETGSSLVRVAVIDTGVDAGHPDLQRNIYKEDGRVAGADFYSSSRDSQDAQFHGTWCAGIIGAEGNNATGISGVNWQVSIIPIRFTDTAGRGSASDAIWAIDFAVEKGADVILAAWGGFGHCSALERAIEKARDAGILFVAAAGNFQIDLDSCPFFPASYPTDNILAVAATDDKDSPLLEWGHGRDSVDLAAPGGGIYSTIPTRFGNMSMGKEPYRSMPGTSGAAAFVAGAAALLKAQDRRRSYAKIRAILMKSIDDPGGTIARSGLCAAGGRIDLFKALYSGAPTPTPASPPSP